MQPINLKLDSIDQDNKLNKVFSKNANCTVFCVLLATMVVLALKIRHVQKNTYKP